MGGDIWERGRTCVPFGDHFVSPRLPRRLSEPCMGLVKDTWRTGEAERVKGQEYGGWRRVQRRNRGVSSMGFSARVVGRKCRRMCELQCLRSVAASRRAGEGDAKRREGRQHHRGNEREHANVNYTNEAEKGGEMWSGQEKISQDD